MVKPNQHPTKDQNQLKVRLDELRSEVKNVDPHKLAQRTMANYSQTSPNQGEFLLQLWEQKTRLTYPSLVAYDLESEKELGIAQQTLIMYYFHTSDGKPEKFRWISFSKLLDGMFYAQAFQGYTGKELARAFGDNKAAFEKAAQNSGGVQHSLGTCSYAFTLLPRVSLLVVYWQGDEDFPSSFQVLFDAAISHHLPTDACAIAGSMLTRKILSAHDPR